MAFKIGDKVKFVGNSLALKYGKTSGMLGFIYGPDKGIVERFDENDGSYKVNDYWYDPEELALDETSVEEETPKEGGRMKIIPAGTKVKVTSTWGHDFDNGAIVTSLEEQHTAPYEDWQKFEDENGFTQWLKEEHFEVIEDNVTAPAQEVIITDFGTLKEGDIVRCVERKGHDHWAFAVGKEYKVKRAGSRFLPLDAEGDPISSEDFGHKFVLVRNEGYTPAPEPAVDSKGPSSGEITPKRVNYLYVVTDADGERFCTTFDRDHAREVKSDLGGKRNGYVITAYAPVKEIR